MNKVIILGVEVADVGREEALGMVRQMVEYHTEPPLTPPPPSPRRFGGLRGTGWKGGDCHYITTPNPEIALAARRDKELRAIINNSFLALADGFGLKIAAWILGQKLEHRIAGADFMLDVCGLSAKAGWPVFLLGGKEGVSKQAHQKLRALYPAINIVGSESGGDIKENNREWLSSDTELINKINQSKAKILFVAFGCPKQEKWIYHNLAKLDTVNLAMTVGGTFDYLAGRARRAPLALRRSGLEWLWRLVHEPRRAGRIWNATARFIWQVIKWRLRMIFSYRRNVAGFIVNKDSQVLIVQRRPGLLVQGDDNNHWQLPQGGAEKGESAHDAILREMREEVGLVNLRIIGRHSKKYRYDWPGATPLREGRRGQNQTIFYLRFMGNNNDVRVDQKEHNDYRWAPIAQAVELVHEVRRPMTQMAVEGYRKLVIGNW